MLTCRWTRKHKRRFLKPLTPADLRERGESQQHNENSERQSDNVETAGEFAAHGRPPCGQNQGPWIGDVVVVAGLPMSPCDFRGNSTSVLIGGIACQEFSLVVSYHNRNVPWSRSFVVNDNRDGLA